MDEIKEAATYSRSPESLGEVAPYEQKFANLVRLCAMAERDGVKNVIVTWPWVLGDTYAEAVESLSRIADAGLALHIVERFRDEKH